MSDLQELQKTLGVSFKDPFLLQQALVHSSYINENPSFAPASNERLEFLGDSVLNMVIAGELYNRYPNHSEGDMTRMRSALVRSSTLRSVAEFISLGDYIYLGKGEEASGGRHKTANLAGAMESLIAAVFLDHGLESARGLILRLFKPKLDRLADNDDIIDYKSQFQQLYQSHYKKTPVYHTTETDYAERDRKFFSEIIIDGTVIGSGYGRSKKSAETSAACSSLKNTREDFTS